MPSDVILTLMINQIAYVSIILIQSVKISNCSRFLCGCLEVDNVTHDNTNQTNTAIMDVETKAVASSVELAK